MARWHALAYVREVPDHELRERLADAVEELYDAEGRDISYPALPCGSYLRDEIRTLEEQADEAERARDVAEDKLEDNLQNVGDLRDEQKKVAELEAQVSELQARIVELELASEVYSDAITMARKLVSLESRTPRAKHVRPARAKKVSSR